jgi:putative Mg2+ transporter-C (MgtC) family protein
MFVIVGNYGWSGLTFGNAFGIVLDPSRVVAYVVTGIGFLGAGTIIKHGMNVRGLTTAASLWVVAAVGVAVGAGEYVLALVASATVILSLWPVRKLARMVGLRAERTHRLQLELGPDARIADVIASIEEQGNAITSARVTDEPELRRLEVVVEEPKADLGRLVAAASAIPDVRTASVAT